MLTDRESTIVRLIDAGLTRRKIAQVSGLSETGTGGVRDIIRDLCEQYECRMDQLPDETRVRWDDDDDCPVCGASLEDDDPKEVTP